MEEFLLAVGASLAVVPLLLSAARLIYWRNARKHLRELLAGSVRSREDIDKFLKELADAEERSPKEMTSVLKESSNSIAVAVRTLSSREKATVFEALSQPSNSYRRELVEGLVPKN